MNIKAVFVVAENHFKLPKHGKSLIINKSNKTDECVKTIFKLHDEATVTLLLIMGLYELSRKVVDVPCSQCVRDMALKFRDLASAIDELIEMK